MRVENLPSPGFIMNGLKLRVAAANAISAVEINAALPGAGGVSANADPLHDFFTTCAAAVNTFRDVTVPTIAARSATPANASRITLTYSEGLSSANVPPVTAFAVTVQARTVTEVTVDGPFVHLDLNAPLVAGAVSVAYTQPGTSAERLQDASDNEAASFTATAVTNTVV